MGKRIKIGTRENTEQPRGEVSKHKKKRQTAAKVRPATGPGPDGMWGSKNPKSPAFIGSEKDNSTLIPKPATGPGAQYSSPVASPLAIKQPEEDFRSPPRLSPVKVVVFGSMGWLPSIALGIINPPLGLAFAAFWTFFLVASNYMGRTGQESFPKGHLDVD